MSLDIRTLIERFPNEGAARKEKCCESHAPACSPEGDSKSAKAAFPDKDSEQGWCSRRSQRECNRFGGSGIIAVATHTFFVFIPILITRPVLMSFDRMVVAGDAAYNESTSISPSQCPDTTGVDICVDKIESLNPRAVVANHIRGPENDDNPRIIRTDPADTSRFDRWRVNDDNS